VGAETVDRQFPPDDITQPFDPPEPSQVCEPIALVWEKAGISRTDGLNVDLTAEPYLEVDTRNSGYLYVFRYNEFTGREWLCYCQPMAIGRSKTKSMISNMRQGMHIFRIWFFHDGIWMRTAVSTQVSNRLDKVFYFPTVMFWAITENITTGKVRLQWDVSDNCNGPYDRTMIELNDGAHGSQYAFSPGRGEYPIITTEATLATIKASNIAGTIVAQTPVEGRRPNPPSPGKEVAKSEVSVPSGPADKSKQHEAIKPPPSADASTETGFLNQMQVVLTRQPLSILWIGILFIIIGMSCGILLARRRKFALSRAGMRQQLFPGSPITRIRKRSLAPERAKLILPNNSKITLNEDSKLIGRADLARALSPEELLLVSREQFRISSENNTYFIEDKNSHNGTKVVGLDIRGRGRQQLKDFDMIEVAGVLSITFNMPPFASKPEDN
jgi:hypothetical protein